MNYPRLSLVLMFALTCGLAFGQPRRPVNPVIEEVPTRKLGVCYLFAERTPSLFFRNADGAFSPLRIDTNRFSAWNVVPAAAQITFYARAADPEQPQGYQMVPAGTFALPADSITDDVRLFFYFTSDGKTEHFSSTASPTVHEAYAVRMFNLTDTTIGVRVGETDVLLQPKAEETLRPVTTTDERFYVQFAYQLPRQAVISEPRRTFRFTRENQRQTMIFGYQPEFHTSENGERKLLGWRIQMLRFYDTVG